MIKEKNKKKVINDIKNPIHINEIEKDLNNLTIISQKQKNLILNLAKKNFNLPMNFKGY